MARMGDKQTRFSFKSDVKFDIALLTEVESLNPFAFSIKKRRPTWDEVASTLVSSDLKMPVNGRSCKDRTTILLQDFSKDETLSQRSSGLEEEDMDKLKKLLTSVKKLSDTPPSSSTQKLYSKSERSDAEKVRDQVLLEIERRDEGEDNTDANDEESAVDQPATSTAVEVPKPKRIRKGDVVEYLEKKHKAEIDVKKEELEIRKYEAQTRRMEIEVEKERGALEHQARMEELNLRKANEDAQNAEKLTMTRAILELLKKN